MNNELHHLYDRKVSCLMCNTNYNTKKVLSRFIRAHRHDTDFCSYYTSTEINPLLYYVSVCPNCGFSSSEECSTYFPPKAKETIQQKVCDNWNGRNYCFERTVDTAIESYKLAIYCASIKKENHVALAGLYLRLSWLFRTEKINHEEEQRFLRLALEEYVHSYMVDDYSGTQLSEIKLLYLIGDLSRRLDLVSQATQYFSKVIEKQKDTLEKGIVQMAKDRWAEMREVKSS
ncbi:DUF2225 domain-containing protein [Metabacillus litoralis]|uniref:DUF2225 domain-containing protein n=1 Tax=Metabacillus TaxID=2675233 RepID=UPI00203E64BA|nr:DUF2225 domain-containing protein [Metabacillus litoralis]MCM3161171.1 DUF2225 domain-containing protein [Metabacillus litoralis]